MSAKPGVNRPGSGAASDEDCGTHDLPGRREFLRRTIPLAAALGTGAVSPAAAVERLTRREPIDGPRSFNMVVLGDSVAWGQGLDERRKYYSIVRRWIESRFGGTVPVNLFRQAHSGAVVGPLSENWPLKHPEVPFDWPTVDSQLADARRNAANAGVPPEAVDLVLVTGGINDVDIRTILSPSPAVTADSVRALTRDVASARMRELVRKAVTPTTGFPRAKVLVTTYYQTVSELSDISGLMTFLSALFGVVSPTALFTAGSTWPLLRWKVATQAAAFQDESTRGLRSAVEAANTVASAPGQAMLVDAGLGPAHAYAAPETHLFYMLDGTESPTVRATRVAECGGVDVVCQLAAMGHPNAKGAARFASEIIRTLTPLIPQCG